MPMKFFPIFEHKGFNVLADIGERLSYAGTLQSEILNPGEWLSGLIFFITALIPKWRDDHDRSKETAEDILTTQLCAHLNTQSRLSDGWDYLQFRREEPDDIDSSRRIDLAVAPGVAKIKVMGREYTQYEILLPIECKRLPTPNGSNRDEREYLYSKYSTTGGVQRFKAGHHASKHAHAAMIGYVQSNDIDFWQLRIDKWVEDLIIDVASGWSEGDKLRMAEHNSEIRVALLQSTHARVHGLKPISLDHIWVEM